MKLGFSLNGDAVEVEVRPDALLLDVVRGLGLTGTKEGCGVGVCGACTLLVNDLPVSSCLFLAACAEATDVWSVEGIAATDEALLTAFIAAEGTQCGICTPGQVVSAAALGRERRREGRPLTEAEIRTFMAGNLCRCTGYASIVDAVRAYLERP